VTLDEGGAVSGEVDALRAGLPSVRRRLVGGSAWWLGAQAAATGAGLLKNVLVARLLNPRDAGTFFLATSFTDLGVIVAQGGVSVVMLRLIAESIATGAHGRARAAIRLGSRAAVAFIAICTGVLALPVASHLAARLFPASRLGAITALVGGMIAVRALAQVLSAALRGFHDFASSAILGLAGGPVLVAAGLLGVRVVSGHTTLRVVAAITVAGAAPTLVIAYLILRSRVGGLSDSAPANASSIDTTGYREILRTALPIFTIGVAGYFQRQVAFWIVGSRLGAADIARFGAAMKLAAVLPLVLWIAGAVAAPIIAELRVLGRKAELERIVRLMVTVGSVPTVVAVLVFAVAGGRVLSVLFGPFYAKAAPILVLLSLGQAFNVLLGLNDTILMMTGHERWAMAATLAGVAAVVIVSYATIGTLGVLGPAVGVIAGYVTTNTLAWIAARVLLGVWTHAGIQPVIAELRDLRQSRRR